MGEYQRDSAGQPDSPAGPTLVTSEASLVVSLAACAVLVAGFAVLVLGVAPSGAWRDVDEFQWAAASLGVPHPPGSPVPAMLGRLAALLPVGAIAWRVNLLSCLAAAVGLAVAYRLAIALLAMACPRLPLRTGCLVASLAPLALVGSPVYREHAATAEVYALQALLTGVLALAWLRTAVAPGARHDLRPLAALVLLTALGTGVHVSFAFDLVALLAWWLVRERGAITPRAAGVLASLVLLGGAVFAYVPVRAAARPSINWGDAVTLDRLRYHLTDEKDWEHHDEQTTESAPAPVGASATGVPAGASSAASGGIGAMVRGIGARLAGAAVWCGLLHGYLLEQLGWFGEALAMAGLALLALRAPAAGWVVTLLIAAHLAFAIPVGKWANPTGYNPIYLLAAALACLPVGALAASRAGSRAALARLGVAVVALAPAAARVASVGDALQRYAEDFRSDDLTRAMVRPLAPDTILLAAHLWPLFGYLREVEGYRTDVDVVFRNEVYETQRMRLDPGRVPDVAVPQTGALETRADRVVHMRAFLDLNHRRGRPIAWQSEADDLFFRVRPAGLLFAYAAAEGGDDRLAPTADAPLVLADWLTSFQVGGSRRFWLREVDDFEEAILPVARYAGWQAAMLACEDAAEWWRRSESVLGPWKAGISWVAGLEELLESCPREREARARGGAS